MVVVVACLERGDWEMPPDRSGRTPIDRSGTHYSRSLRRRGTYRSMQAQLIIIIIGPIFVNLLMRKTVAF